MYIYIDNIRKIPMIFPWFSHLSMSVKSPHWKRSSKDPLAATLEVEKRRRVEVGVGVLPGDFVEN